MSIWDKERNLARDLSGNTNNNNDRNERTIPPPSSCPCTIMNGIPKGKVVDVLLKYESRFENLIFQEIDYKNNCAHFIDDYEKHSHLIILCQEIQAIKIYE